MDSEFLPIRDDHVETLEAPGGQRPAYHCFEPDQLRAINAALACGRPLLVRGEPGIGKSQLARAAAKALGRAFITHVVDARTESRDLLWHFDAIGRLAEAQAIGALQPRLETSGCDDAARKAQIETALTALRARLRVDRFLHPRALWWALNWESAAAQAAVVSSLAAEQPPQPDGGDRQRGCVVLIDEIDKAESDVPNGLLEALGAGCFTPQGHAEPVTAVGPPPLVVVTTNEERALPDAFIRRCLVLHLALPREPEALVARLIERGRTHFGDVDGRPQVLPEVLATAANLLADDRAEALRRQWRPLPGQAEYLDLVRAVVVQARGDLDRQAALIGQVANFVLRKHADAVRAAPATPS
jgi:MoxR-like ATPase